LVRSGSSPATARKIHSVLFCGIDVAVDDEMLAINPAAGIKVAKPTVTPRRYLTHHEVERLASAAGDIGRPVILTLAYCGLRWGELAALKVQNVLIARARIRVEASVTEVGGKMQWGDP
jgi:integrase